MTALRLQSRRGPHRSKAQHPKQATPLLPLLLLLVVETTCSPLCSQSMLVSWNCTPIWHKSLLTLGLTALHSNTALVPIHQQQQGQ
jgi:hypothetical protein